MEAFNKEVDQYEQNCFWMGVEPGTEARIDTPWACGYEEVEQDNILVEF